MKLFRLALKLLIRDARAGELTLLLLALLIAVTSSSAISLFADRLQRTMVLQAAEFLAGDLVVAGPAPIDERWLSRADELGLQRAQTVEFASMLLENQAMLLASVKAVSDAYPLRGQLKITDGERIDTVRHGPEPGKVWLENRVLSALQLSLGDTLTVGEKTLLIDKILRYEPDKRGDFYSLSPRVMMHSDDLQATGVIQPGSRVRYAYQFNGSEDVLAGYRDGLQAQLNPSQKILDIHRDRPELGSALERAERYLGLSSIVVILIAGTAIAMAARRYSERHFNAAALLRCLGCRQKQIVRLYAYQFLLLGLLTGAAGCGLGWLAQFGLFEFLKNLLPEQLAQPSGLAVLFGVLSGFSILLGFALPPLLRLRRVSALRVLRRELAPLPASAWLVYGLALSLVTALIWRYTGDAKMTLTILGTGLAALSVLGLSVGALLRLAGKALPHLSLCWRFALQGMVRNQQASVGQILAFALTLTAMALSFTVRNDLLDNWRQQLPAQAPNYFALNIFPNQKAGFEADLKQAQIAGSRFYPIVRGRLVTINDEAVQQRVSKDSQGENATSRELSLTWGEHLPEDNKITAGGAWQALQPNLVSVEAKLAANLNIRVGDRLGFTVGSSQLSATVANLRSVQWDTMRPNFYMIFSPGTLESFPTTYLTSFYLAGEDNPRLSALLKKYPAVTLLEVEQILAQFKTLLAQLTQAVDLLLYFALAAGFTVLFAAVYATLDQRLYEGALMRALGAKRSLLRNTHLIEFGLLGILAGLLAAIAVQAILYVLYTRVMHMDYRLNPDLWAILPAAGLIGVGSAGYWGVRQVVKEAPLKVLRR